MLKAGRPGFLENFQKMDRPLVVLPLPKRARKERKTHRVVRVGNGESLPFPEEFARRW